MTTGVFDDGLIVNRRFIQAKEFQVAARRNPSFYALLSYFSSLLSVRKKEEHKQHGNRAQKCRNGDRPNHAFAPASNMINVGLGRGSVSALCRISNSETVKQTGKIDMRRFIISGAPGAGKTAIIRQLEL